MQPRDFCRKLIIGSIIAIFSPIILFTIAASTQNATENHSAYTNETKTSEKNISRPKESYVCSNGTKYDTANAKDECEKRIAWEKGRDQALQECNADASKTNCWYDEYPGTYIHWTEQTYTYTPAPNNNYRSGAICRDGWRSSATGRGACSHHDGVAYWI